MPCECVITCDVCGKPGDSYGYDGIYLCELHVTLNDLEEARQEWQKKQEWFEACWGRKLRQRIAELETKLAQLNQEKST